MHDGFVPPKTFSRYKMNHGKWIQIMNNQSQLISGKDSNRSHQNQEMTLKRTTQNENTWQKSPAGVAPLEAWSPMTLWMGGRRQPDGMSEANLQRLHPRRAHQRTKWRFNATIPPSWEFFPWIKTPDLRTTWQILGSSCVENVLVRTRRFSS